MIRRITVLLVLAAALPLVGCQNLEERFTPPPTIVTEEATRAVSGAQVVGELDEDTPEDLPLWPGAEVFETAMTEDAYSLTLVTADTFSDVLSGVAAGFEESGWTIAREEAGDEGARTAILEISREGQEGFITLTEVGDGLTQIDYVVAIVEE